MFIGMLPRMRTETLAADDLPGTLSSSACFRACGNVNQSARVFFLGLHLLGLVSG